MCDLGSRNGVFCNGERVEGSAPLQEGDELMLGVGGPRLVLVGVWGSFVSMRDEDRTRMVEDTSEIRALVAGEEGTSAVGDAPPAPGDATGFPGTATAEPVVSF